MGWLFNDNMGLTGSAVRDPNFQLRICIILFMGIVAFGAVIYWRSQLLLSSEYVDIPVAKHLQANRLYQDDGDLIK